MALDQLTTEELAFRLSKTKFGHGDPIKANNLFLACVRRLRELSSQLESVSLAHETVATQDAQGVAAGAQPEEVVLTATADAAVRTTKTARKK